MANEGSEVAKPSMREIEISSTPTGADVHMGEDLLGKTPLKVEIDLDREAIFEASLKGYKSASLSIPTDNTEDSFTLKLAKVPARLNKPNIPKNKAGGKAGGKAGRREGPIICCP